MARSRLIAGLAVVLITAVSCRESPTAPVTPAGTYVLRSIAGRLLPYSYGGGPGGTATLLADTVEFRDDRPVDGGVYARVIAVVRLTGSSVGPDTTYQYANDVSYQISDGNRIALANCPMGAMCVVNPVDTGRVLQDGLLLGSARTGTWATWMYARVGDTSP